MSNCRNYRELIENILIDEISTEERKALEGHCSSCPDCAGLMDLHSNLQQMGAGVPMPQRHEMRDMREAVLAATSEDAASRPAADSQDAEVARGGFLVDLTKLWRAHPLPTGLATAAVLVFMFFLGQRNTENYSFEDELHRQSVKSPIAQQAGLESYRDAPYSFANVTVRPGNQGQLELSFDVSHHLNIQVSQDSPLAKEVLLHAILEPSSMGSRLSAMAVTPAMQDDSLKEALVMTMLNDPDPTVRRNAMAVLNQYPYDQNSQEAYLQTLSQDQDVQMRLTALEELARRNVGMETIREAVGKEDPNGTMAILRHASATF